MKMTLVTVFFLTLLAACTQANDIEGRKVYECKYMANAPQDISAWAGSDMVKNGVGKESRFVPYNSPAAQIHGRDAASLPDVTAEPEPKDRETSFYMAYDEKGWYTYIQCNQPDIQSFVDRDRDISIELFFSPGLEDVPYYQMVIRQLAKTTNHYDWAMSDRYYRPLKGRADVNSRPIEGGIATLMFIPWDALYDRVPFNENHWRFSFMRGGDKLVTWGGKVHDTGNFGLVRFEKPSDAVASAIRNRMLRAAWFKFQRDAKAATAFWNDDKLGDKEFYETVLKPVIEEYTVAGADMAKDNVWDTARLKNADFMLGEWMEFNYKASELREDYLRKKLCADRD